MLFRGILSFMVSENNDVHLYIMLLVLAITNERFSNGGNMIEKGNTCRIFYIKIGIFFLHYKRFQTYYKQ